MKKKMMFLCHALAGTSCLCAQSIGPNVVNTSGGSAVLAGNTHEFAIGGLLVNTYNSSGLVVTPYVLQPLPPTVGIDDKDFFADNLVIFPNPAENVLFLKPSFRSGGKLSFILYDALGRVMSQAEITLATGKEQQSIGLKSLAAGTYLLHIGYQQRGKNYQTSYKVQKLQ